MQLRCPVCKAENTPSPCRRCKADLTLLFALERQRQEALWRAKESLRAGYWAEAQEQAARADHLRRDDESQRLLAVAALLCGDHATAWRCYCELTAGGASSPPPFPSRGLTSPGSSGG